MTTEDKRLFIIGQEKVCEFNMAGNSYENKGDMGEKKVWACVAYEHTQDKIYIMGGVDSLYNSVDTCDQYDIKNDKLTQFP